MNKRTFGAVGEQSACDFLTANGWRIVDRNVRMGPGEIDIIAQRDGLYAFVEVKRRTSAHYGSPVEAVTPLKQKRLVGTAMLYMQKKDLEDARVRFDVIEIMPQGIRHIEDAFDASDMDIEHG